MAVSKSQVKPAAEFSTSTGFGAFRTATWTPFNLVFEARP